MLKHNWQYLLCNNINVKITWAELWRSSPYSVIIKVQGTQKEAMSGQPGKWKANVEKSIDLASFQNSDVPDISIMLRVRNKYKERVQV